MAEEYGLTVAGFRLKRLRTILDEVKTSMMKVKDPDTGETLNVNFDEDDPFIQFINICCDEMSAIWEALNAAYDQFDPLKATGPMLSVLVQLNGIVRKQGDPSMVDVTFYGDDDTVVPVGTMVTDQNNKVTWLTISSGTIADGSVTLGCASEERGAFEAEAGTINQMLSTVVGVTSVVNLTAAEPGTASESDIALRRRREKSTETPSQGLAESIYGSIAAIEGVSYCKIFVNRTMNTDANGIPPKSIAVVVQVEDKDDEDLKKEIASNIFLRSGLGEEYYNMDDVAGLPSYVSQYVEFTDKLQQTTTVKFVYPLEVPIKVKVSVSALEHSSLPNDYEQQIKSNIVKFAEEGVQGLNIETDSVDVFDDYGFPPSEDIVVSRLYTPLNVIPGCKVNSLQIAKGNGSYSSADIEIAWYEVGKFTEENIIVELG